MAKKNYTKTKRTQKLLSLLKKNGYTYKGKEFKHYHLRNIIYNYDYIRHGLKRHNRHYIIVMRVLIAFTLLNWIISSIMVIYNFYNIKTVTSLLTNILLISTKIYSSYRVASESKNKNIAISSYMTEYTSYNIIDKDYLKKLKKILNN